MPVFWSNPPLYTLPDEVVLRARLKAHSEHIDEDGAEPEFLIMCGTHRSGLVFDVVETLHGDFNETEIAIISNDHSFHNEPEIGEERIVVGKIQRATHVGQRYVISDSLSDRMDQVESSEESETLWSEAVVGPPSQISALQPRAPVELRLLFLFERPANWLVIGPGVLVVMVALFFGWRAFVHRKRIRP
jgi:hypothetical protein